MLTSLTIIFDGYFVLKVDKCRKFVNRKFNFNLLIGDFDKFNILRVDDIVHNLKTLEHSGKGFDVFVFIEEDEDISFLIQNPETNIIFLTRAQ